MQNEAWWRTLQLSDVNIKKIGKIKGLPLCIEACWNKLGEKPRTKKHPTWLKSFYLADEFSFKKVQKNVLIFSLENCLGFFIPLYFKKKNKILTWCYQEDDTSFFCTSLRCLFCSSLPISQKWWQNNMDFQGSFSLRFHSLAWQMRTHPPVRLGSDSLSISPNNKTSVSKHRTWFHEAAIKRKLLFRHGMFVCLHFHQ